ncbi:MAG: M28 family peptidase [Leptolyngbya sp. RL_3_1]|nr:M28 family peptidase [Leptolyngbya sp. RL_3_1]
MANPQRMEAMPTLEQRLLNHLNVLGRDRDPYLAAAGHQWVQDYIRAEFSQWGVVERHSFQVRGQTHYNWILKLPSGEPEHPGASPLAPILVGAHYDAVPGTPGADDNASGVAVLLELARYAHQHPLKRPLWCVAFDMEEYGLLGSRAYGQALKDQGQPLRLMLSLEMLGYCDETPHSQQYPKPWLGAIYPNQGNFIGLIGNLPSLLDLRQLKRQIIQVGAPCEWLPVPFKGHLIPSTRLSDHAPFWDLGYRAAMVTDTAFLRNPHYHKGSDRLETLNLNFMAKVALGLMAGLTATS